MSFPRCKTAQSIENVHFFKTFRKNSNKSAKIKSLKSYLALGHFPLPFLSPFVKTSSVKV